MAELPHFAYPTTLPPFSHVEDNWDLHAVVRSCSSYDFSAAANALWETFFSSTDSCSNNTTSPSSIFPSTDLTSSSSPSSLLDELEEVYKPFYPELHLLSENTDCVREEEEPQQLREQPFSAPVEARVAATRFKKRKLQEKKMVHQVTTTDIVGSDMWAWRKYGQKPIKGSPHPRSYYRCSSSKGCLARKQVERSKSDPGKFIVTYSEEHNHACPTRRSTLAGSCRSKAPAGFSPAANKDEDCSSPDSVAVVSPATPFAERGGGGGGGGGGGEGELLVVGGGGCCEEVEDEDGREENDLGLGCRVVEEEDDEGLVVAGRDFFAFDNFFLDEDYH